MDKKLMVDSSHNQVIATGSGFIMHCESYRNHYRRIDESAWPMLASQSTRNANFYCQEKFFFKHNTDQVAEVYADTSKLSLCSNASSDEVHVSNKSTSSLSSDSLSSPKESNEVNTSTEAADGLHKKFNVYNDVNNNSFNIADKNLSAMIKRPKSTYPFGKCNVCSDKATGIHYGIATCEGCKVNHD